MLAEINDVLIDARQNELWNICETKIYVSHMSNGSLVVESLRGQIRLFFWESDLLLLSNSEFTDRFHIDLFNMPLTLSLDFDKFLMMEETKMIMNGRGFYASQNYPKEVNIGLKSFKICLEKGLTRGTARWCMWIVDDVFSKGYNVKYTMEGAVIKIDHLISAKSTIIRQLDKLSEMNIIRYFIESKENIVMKFNRTVISIDNELQPAFFDYLIYE